MSQSNFPYYNYRAFPQGYTPQQQGQMGQMGQMGFPAGQQQMAPQQLPGSQPTAPMGMSPGAPGVQMPGMLPAEASYVENILRLNRGKLATVYMSFEGSTEWNSKIFKGIIEAAGRDHLILSDPQTGMRYLLLMVYLDYVTFEEELDYDYPFGGGGMAVYPPR
ncbi:spore coat protein GerQ [Bacillus sp. FJAT-27251]|uniref:spore coat protein GerQ n=1 Tax=Bacillus sp. FJAT-27251 TaxID=1684142 RepID=UPI0006A7E44A|nr:spore coat protein GerQ [Bacillus sp. FJAT-27251]